MSKPPYPADQVGVGRYSMQSESEREAVPKEIGKRSVYMRLAILSAANVPKLIHHAYMLGYAHPGGVPPTQWSLADKQHCLEWLLNTALQEPVDVRYHHRKG